MLCTEGLKRRRKDVMMPNGLSIKSRCDERGINISTCKNSRRHATGNQETLHSNATINSIFNRRKEEKRILLIFSGKRSAVQKVR